MSAYGTVPKPPPPRWLFGVPRRYCKRSNRSEVVSRRTQYYERIWHSSKASATSVVVRGASTVLQVGYGRPGSMHLVAEGDGLVLR
ncbi:hypothetical protein CDAR_124441 [Caerostris darwini]|uniref:Uncharacterized protein n=1 Tax=Caerostris darwini TaxID=1538125 RepID=A0AAV4RMX4_9ARAC|nr:hypothetical protein CDAR_124441 [Caerostris darwini]